MKFSINENVINTQFDFDTMTISGDETEGISPIPLLVSSLVGCSMLVYRRILEKQKIEYDEMYVEADVERSDNKLAKSKRYLFILRLKEKI